jgi:N-formylglutamate amidohydrolase
MHNSLDAWISSNGWNGTGDRRGTRFFAEVIKAHILSSTIAMILASLFASSTAAQAGRSAGQAVFGRNQYIEYIPGNLPVIISAGHGGRLIPTDIPARTFGNKVFDKNTQELARGIAAEFVRRTGKYPHLVINRLSRTRLDPNREITEGAQHANSRIAWTEWHDFIREARAEVTAQHGRGLYLDLHGQVRHGPRTEVGYRLDESDWALSDAVLNADASYERTSSLRTLSERSPLTFAQLHRGPTSFGSLLEKYGYTAVPSAAHPSPNSAYYGGAYNTDTHGCSGGGTVCGLQLETEIIFRRTAAGRLWFAEALVKVYDDFFNAHYGMDLVP